MADLEAIQEKVQKGDAPGTKELVQAALDEGADPQQIFFDGLIAGMKVVIDKFKRNEASTIANTTPTARPRRSLRAEANHASPPTAT